MVITAEQIDLLAGIIGGLSGLGLASYFIYKQYSTTKSKGEVK